MNTMTGDPTHHPPEPHPECPVEATGWHMFLNPFVPPYLDDPASFHERLRKEAPVAYNEILGMWLVSRYDDIHTVLKDPARFSAKDTLHVGTEPTPEARAILAEGFPEVLSTPTAFNTDPPRHTRLRRQLSRALTPALISAQEANIRRISHELIDAFATRGHADIVSEFAYPLPAQVIMAMMGFPEEDMPRIKHWCDDWFSFVWERLPPERQVSAARSIVDYQKYATELIEQRRKEPREDMLSKLVSPDPEGEDMSLQELLQTVCSVFIGAGHETTTHMLTRAMLVLLSQPGLWQSLRQDRSRLPKAIEESMRLAPMLHGMVRTTTEEVELGGVRLPRGARLLLLFASGNHDERQFPRPRQFDLNRPNVQHQLAFGRGVHYCLGAPLARLEARIGFEVFLDRLPDLSLVPDQPLEHTMNVAIHGLKHLRVEWDPQARGDDALGHFT